MSREIDNYEWKKVDEDDPRRCQFVNRTGQCRNISVEGSNFCKAHGGFNAIRKKQKEDMRNYRLAKFKARALELSDSDNISSLRDEVALLRMLIEEKINRCNDASQLLMMSGPLSDLIIKVEKVVTSMNRLEGRLGMHLDKTKIIQFSQVMIEIIGKYIDNPEVLDAIGEDFHKALSEL